MRYYCERCLNPFKTAKILDKHVAYCKNHDAVKITLPKESTLLSFKNYNNSIPVPFVITNFECLTENLDTCQPEEQKSYTQQYQKYKPSGFCYLIKCYDDSLYEPKLHRYTAKSEDEDPFVESIERSVRKLYSKVHYYSKVRMMDKDK